MPELPEVEVVRRGLADHVVGRTFSHVALHGSRVARRHVPGPEDLTARLAGRTVLAADRRGKYLWLALDGAEGLVVHLGMSGQMLVEDPTAPRRRHQHATFSFADDGPQLRFVDQRTFGGLALAELVPDPRGGDHPHGVPASVTHIALDPLEAAFEVVQKSHDGAPFHSCPSRYYGPGWETAENSGILRGGARGGEATEGAGHGRGGDAGAGVGADLHARAGGG